MCVEVNRGGQLGARQWSGGIAPGLTFWATWLTHGEVQLLRSGPRGFHMTWSAKHWNDAMPGEEGRKKKQERSNGELIGIFHN